MNNLRQSWAKIVDDRLRANIQNALSDDLRRAPYKGNPNPHAGHCYVASEAYYHLKGGEHSGLKPMYIQHEGSPHWFLIHKETGENIDLTSSQFKSPVPYEKAIGKGFLTKQPSKRAQELIHRVS